MVITASQSYRYLLLLTGVSERMKNGYKPFSTWSCVLLLPVVIEHNSFDLRYSHVIL